MEEKKEYILKELISSLEYILKCDVNTDKWLDITEENNVIKAKFNMELDICKECLNQKINK